MLEARKHRKSGVNFEELLNKEWSILSRVQYIDLQVAFKRTEQRNGGISFYDLINIIRSMSLFHSDLGLTVSEERKDKINKDINNKEIRILNFQVLLNTTASLKKEKEENYRGQVPEENEYRNFIFDAVDAFVALGGKSDKSGYVNKSALMEIVKREFELSLDL